MTLLGLFVLSAIALSVALGRAGIRPPPASSSAAARREPERLLIVGATGGTGRQLVAQALERGYSVTALVRDPSRLPIEHPRLHVMRGDVLDYPSVEAAMPAQEVVL